MSFAGAVGSRSTGTVLTRAEVLQALAGSPEAAAILSQNVLTLSQEDLNLVAADPNSPGTMMLLPIASSIPSGWLSIPDAVTAPGLSQNNYVLFVSDFNLQSVAATNVQPDQPLGGLISFQIAAQVLIPLSGAIVPVLGPSLHWFIAAPPFGMRWIIKL